MAYHNTNSSVPSNARQSTTNNQGQTAPAGFHYMPDGTLMSDVEHALLYGNKSTKYYNPYEKDPVSVSVASKVIKSFNLDFQNIKTAGESRRFTISGDNGATFSLEIKNEDNYYYNFQTNLFQTTKTGLTNEVISAGAYNGIIKFPKITPTTDTVNGAVTSGTSVTMDTAVASTMKVGDRITGNTALNAAFVTVASIDSTNVFSLSEAVAISDGVTLSFTGANQYDFYLFAIDTEDTKHSEYVEVRYDDGTIDINSSSGSNSNLMKKVIYQALDVVVTLQPYSPSGDITGAIGTQAITTSRNKGAAKIPFSYTFTVTSTRTLSINRQPTENDMMVFVTPTIGSAPIDIPGENIYPTATTAFTGDDVNVAVTSGAIVRIDAVVLGGDIAAGDKITTPVMTDTVNCSDCSSATAIIMDAAVATKMAVGDQVTGNAVLDATVITVAAINVGGDANTFSLSSAVAIADGTTLSFSSKINRSVTTVASFAPLDTAANYANKFTMSQDIQFRDNAPLTFFNRRNYRWPIDNIDKLQSGMRVLGGTASGFSDIVTIKEYLDQITLFEGEINEEKIVKERVAPLDTLSVKPTLTRDAATKVVATVQTGNIAFSEQALFSFGGETIKVFSYGPSEIKRLTDYDLEFSDLAVALTKVTTTTTAAVTNHTSVPITNRAGIMDAISSVSGIGIDPSVANPTVASGAGSVTGAGTIVLSAAQTLEDGITLTFPGAGTIATVTGYIKINNVGNENLTLRLDLDKVFTMH